MVCIGKKWCFQSHLATHTGKKDHICDTCGASFTRQDQLRKHIQRIHEHSGNYMCAYCDYRTVQQMSLDIHVNAVHTKAIKYSCEECNFSCYTKGNLTAHRKTVHLKLKPHKCPICPEAFVRRTDLEKHISSHWNTTLKVKSRLFLLKRAKFKTFLSNIIQGTSEIFLVMFLILKRILLIDHFVM